MNNTKLEKLRWIVDELGFLSMITIDNVTYVEIIDFDDCHRFGYLNSVLRRCDINPKEYKSYIGKASVNGRHLTIYGYELH